MNDTLKALRSEISEHLVSRGLVVFESDLRSVDTDQAVFWNVDREPDYKRFVAAAEAAGARLVTIFSRDLNLELLESLVAKLDEMPIDKSERRALERGIRDLRPYQGLTGQIELSFDLAGRDYIFDLRSDWFDELDDLMESITAALGEVEDDDDDDAVEPMGPYFSRN